MSIRYSLRAPSGQETAVTGPFRIGRDSECQIRIDNGLVSRIHASVWLDHDHLLLRDERSRNGTQLNGLPLKPGEAHYLHHDDQVTIGDTVLLVVSDPPYPRPRQHGGLPGEAEPPPTAKLDKQAVQAAAAGAAAASAANPSAAPARRLPVVPLVIGGCLALVLLALCAGLGFAAIIIERPAISTLLAPHARQSPTPGAGAGALTSLRSASWICDLNGQGGEGQISDPGDRSCEGYSAMPAGSAWPATETPGTTLGIRAQGRQAGGS
jgi:hypothetical protein